MAGISISTFEDKNDESKTMSNSVAFRYNFDAFGVQGQMIKAALENIEGENNWDRQDFAVYEEKFEEGYSLRQTGDDEAAFKCFAEAASAGHSEAIFHCGVCNYDGIGVEKNEEIAVAWFMCGAQQGHADSQYWLGYCFRNGKGVMKDADEARMWFERAYENGNALSAHELGYSPPFIVDMAEMNADSTFKLHMLCMDTPSLQDVLEIIRDDPLAAFRRDMNDQTALNLACLRGASVEVVEALIRSEPDNLYLPDKYGCLPLHYACQRMFGKPEVVELLMKECPGAAHVAAGGKFPLHYACYSYQPYRVFAALLRECPLAANFPHPIGGGMPLHIVCENMPANIVALVLEAGVESVGVRDDNMKLPLHVACRSSASFEVIDMLLRAYPQAARERVASTGMLPLHCALLSHSPTDLRIVKALLDLFPESASDALTSYPHQGKLALHLACEKGESLGVITALMKAYPAAVSTKDFNDKVPLHNAFIGENLAVVKAIWSAFPEAVKMKDVYGNLPVDLAREHIVSDEIIGILQSSLTGYDKLIEEFMDTSDRIRREMNELPVGSEERKAKWISLMTEECVFAPSVSDPTARMIIQKLLRKLGDIQEETRQAWE
uniref:Uncharacterized protein n=1 Tax=viral metagenome TaxID=1070528 RepID=A0A6C0I8C0_9ZZZZ